MTDNRFYVPILRRRELLEHEPVTLNGMPATIKGVMKDYATIVQMPNGPSADFAWTTVEHIITHHNGDFRA